MKSEMDLGVFFYLRQSLPLIWKNKLRACALVICMSGLSACVSAQNQETKVGKGRDYFFKPYNELEETPMPVRTGSDKRPILEKKFQVIETGLGPMVNTALGADYGPFGIWLNDDLLMVNAIQDVPGADEKKLQRVMLVDARTGHSTTLLPNKRVICWSSELQIASFADLTYNQQTVRTLMHLDKEGKLKELSEKPDVDVYVCRSEKANAPSGSATYLLESDGFIVHMEKITSGNANNIDKAIWYKPGNDPKELPIRSTEISEAIYLPHLQRYLLNKRDSQANSDTDKRLGGANWNRPYDLTPYRLMRRDGSIEEIPYPKIIFEYGVRYFGVMMPTRAGIVLVASSSKRSEYGLFLLQGDQLFRFLGGPRPFGIDGREGVSKLSLSPDGCKIAFNLHSDWRPMKKQITIINLCKEK